MNLLITRGLEALTRMFAFLRLQWSSLVSVWGPEIAWVKIVNVFFFQNLSWYYSFFNWVEVSFKKRATYLWALLFILGIFSARRFFWEKFPSPPTNKDLACVIVPFSFMLRWHLRRHRHDTLHVLRSEKQTCGHIILKYQEKKTSKNLIGWCLEFHLARSSCWWE